MSEVGSPQPNHVAVKGTFLNKAKGSNICYAYQKLTLNADCSTDYAFSQAYSAIEDYFFLSFDV